MYRNKKFNRNSRKPSTESASQKRSLGAIDENTTIKIPPSKIGKSNNVVDNEFASIFDDDNDMLQEPQSSEENIPASQEPVQRYLSQRSNKTCTLGRIQSWNSTHNNTRPPNTYFELALTNAGVDLNGQKRPLGAIDENTTIKIPPSKIGKSNNVVDNEFASIFDDDNDMLQEPQSSEENIPASQEPVQRYLSQRSNIACTLGRIRSWNSTHNNTRPPNTYFELVLTNAGVDLNDGDTFVLSCDHIAFVSKFRDLLRNSRNYPDNIETFKTGLRSALEPNSKLALKLLIGCTIVTPDEDTIYQSQDSMIFNFFMIDFICGHVLDILLEKIESAASESRSTANSELLPLMLAQLRYVVVPSGDVIYKRIRKIFENATENGRLDIITNAVYVLVPKKHDEFVQMLLDTVESTSDFFNKTIILSLKNLFLSPQMQGKLREKIYDLIENNQCPNNLLPLLIEFMLKILNEDKDIYIRELVVTLRKVLLHNVNANTNAENNKEHLLELFGHIKKGLIRSRKFYTIWQRAIAAQPENEFKYADFIILLMLIHIKEDNLFYIENILRRRIKNENLTLDVLRDARSRFGVILDKYMLDLMHILQDFLREKHVAVANFSRSAYVILFENGETVQKLILKKLLELTLYQSSQKMANIALDLLKKLHRSHPKEFQNWGMLLLPLLDCLNEMTLSQTRVVMELLCSIAYPVPPLVECSDLQDQIDMLVKKQMINRMPHIKKQGIIGCVQLIYCIARVEEISTETDFENLSINTISDIPEGRGKIAAQLFERVLSAIKYCPESLALFYDEFASVLVASASERSDRGYLDKTFLLWLSETMISYFQDCFTVKDDTHSIKGVPLSGLKSINSVDDLNSEFSDDLTLSIAVNIAGLVLKPLKEASSSIFVLAPSFNLLRVLYLQRSEGSLESINALLGCAIVLPTFFDEVNWTEHIRNKYDLSTQKDILDIYFHCASWLRETISSFITQRDASTKNKVLQRFNYLIKVEGRIRQLLLTAPSDYCPPKCKFTSVTANKAAKAKLKSSSKAKTVDHTKDLHEKNETTILDETAGHTMQLGNTIRQRKTGNKQRTPKLDFISLYGPRENYRQNDSSIMLILCEELNIEMPFPDEDIGHKIGLYELRFLLTDIVSKLESITGVEKLHSEENLQYIAKPHYFFNDLSTFLKNIWKNMKKISIAINEQLEKVGRVFSNMDLFTEDFCNLRVCFDLSLRLIAVYFSWQEFADDSQKKLLKKSLLNLADINEKEQSNTTFAELVAKVFNNILEFKSTTIDLKSANYLYNLLMTLRKFAASNNAESAVLDKQAQYIRALCKNFLQRRWYGYNGLEEKGARCNSCLDELVKGFLRSCDFKRLHDILSIVQEEAKNLKRKDSAMKSFPNLKTANFPILYRGLCDNLVNFVNESVITHSSTYTSNKLQLWETSCKLLNTLLDILKETHIPRNFPIFFKYSHIYLKLVLEHAMPEMEMSLRRDSDRVLAFLKSMQITTRYLHNLCCHAKVKKITAIINQIPMARATMETFVYRVKAMLAANKCSSVFILGILRNKDIHGNELVSESVMPPPSEDSEEEMPEDDETVCESILDPNALVHENMKENTASTSKSSTRSSCY